MFLPVQSIWCIVLTLCMSVYGLEIPEYEVICSQGLSDCTIMSHVLMTQTVAEDNNAVYVQKLTPSIKLCCRDSAPCTLCLMIDIEINIHLDKVNEDESSGYGEEDYSEVTERNPKASVTVCYSVPTMMPTCKKVEFTVNHTALTLQNQAKIIVKITKPAGISFSSHVIVHSSAQPKLLQKVDAPSLDEVCVQEQKEHVKECHGPSFSCVVDQKMNWVELQFGRNKSLPFVCVQYEKNGICQSWNRTTIPLHSVTPCMCLQVWDEDDQRPMRTQSCPFINNTDFFQRSVWQNVSVCVSLGPMNNYHTMLSWNLSAPCRLEGEVWPCQKENSYCREVKGFRQQLENGTWRQNSKGQWETIRVFEDIHVQLSACVMVELKGMGRVLGPFCLKNTDRSQWILLVVGVMLLVCLTVLIFYLLHDFVKKWAWSWHHGGFVKIGRNGHMVVLLSPPDVDDGVSESVCRLGSQLFNQGFRVSVDQWSRKEQCTMGPLPWLHSQLLEMKSLGGRIVLVLTPKALERAEEWTHGNEAVSKMKGDNGLPQICSPYSDVFTASLFLIQAAKQLGIAGERFLLVEFDSHPSIDKRLPELLQGLPLFQLPSQIQALLSELTGRGSGRRTWTSWKWSAKTKEGKDKQMASQCKYVAVERNLGTTPLKFP
ncbi:interleukin-17 receptor C-like isoform X2 [Etheostoma cragini]|uniref:interleukin-17 receptor C-like isoform X2 n=1 Tax=Etheostoma cragini TaxID=417921 RepID=UPI00155EF245|nr:interleukin-17 receptor C-like isoform X2 [Etheostoma cragini]